MVQITSISFEDEMKMRWKWDESDGNEKNEKQSFDGNGVICEGEHITDQITFRCRENEMNVKGNVCESEWHKEEAMKRTNIMIIIACSGDESEIMATRKWGENETWDRKDTRNSGKEGR